MRLSKHDFTLFVIFLSMMQVSCSHIEGLFGEETEPKEVATIESTESSVARPIRTELKDRNGKTIVVLDEASYPKYILPEEDRRDLDLTISKLNLVIQQIENKLKKQQEKIKVLEKGLLLGVIPEELKVEYQIGESWHHPGSTINKITKPENKFVIQPKKEKIDAVASEMTMSERREYRKQLVEAQTFFDQGKYGQAIAAFGKVGHNFRERINEGSHLYWIGLSWFHLREYNSAKQVLTQFISQYGSHHLVPRAHFYIAKVDQKTDLPEHALTRWNKVIDTFPNNEAAEMSKLEIKRFENNL